MAKRASAAKATASIEVAGGSPSRTTRARPVVRLVRNAQPRGTDAAGQAPASVFISYSRLDERVCDQIVRELKERGHAVWLDREAIHGGDVWRANIEKGIKKAEVFVILLSPNVSENPDYTQEELAFARQHHKKIIAVQLKPQKTLPEGFDLILSGRQYIDMTDFDRGMQKLFEALGGSAVVEPAEPVSLWDRALRKAQRVRAAVVNSDLGPAALKLGVAALAGAGAVAVAVMTINDEKRKAALRAYRASVDKILSECVLQLSLTEDMTPEDYAREFRPRARRLLGRLEATPVPTDDLRAHHAELTRNLESAVDEFDEAVAKLERGDVGPARRAVARFVAAFSETLKSYAAWLDSQK
jgi:hypothetical protein